ncbi:MAG: hypothetical protein C0619_00205 [Desulfuromonas sp.]|nr:MAG: hypothetical protein C0619_00205 [Desulfuromonas sp.]
MSYSLPVCFVVAFPGLQNCLAKTAVYHVAEQSRIIAESDRLQNVSLMQDRDLWGAQVHVVGQGVQA